MTGARRLGDGSLAPYADRAAIEAERRDPILWVRDAVEAFLVQVQGSAQVAFADRRRARLAYDGRNGLPYTSIGKILIESGEIAASDMSLANLKAWLRRDRARGLALMQRNRSFVFFRLVEDFDPALGPVAGAGVPLTPLRSIAVDRTIWAYGLPFWIAADLPWEDDALRPFRRLMVAQDTGSAIVGPARADIFFGSGDEAGARAGAIRHRADFTVLSRGRTRREGAAAPRPQRLRRLTDEEIALWTEVARSVARRRGAILPTPSGPVRPGRAPHPPAAQAEPSSPRLAKTPPPPLAPIERRLKRELQRGRAEIDAALDLHGLTQAEAHQALRGFLRHSQARGARLVIVVTGKGGGPFDEPGTGERGVLRRVTPHWLREADLRSVVLGFEEAGRAHGGAGALYVRLRRRP